ncbi:PRK06851 family protein [Calidifontibacillus erzurumensis]|uniref:ATPase n=1 Tax=Calidifontibacillus erzurumensis TaxID=2741433 RepID=A0A8J8GJ81_9BACI|nr:PRK06851 family protein [Calidifontibacillus erzurumensis]NSL53315.1 hypothetical protein [Calidifontibacillus erzurumensis]
MTGTVINYYAGGNTALGFQSFFESNLQGLKRLYILKGGPGTGKSTLMKKIGEEWKDRGYRIEYIHCSSDNNSIDGVIIRELGVGVVDGTAPHVIEPIAPGAVEEYVNLGEAWDSKKLTSHKEEIIDLTKEISKSFQTAYQLFNEGLKIHDEWEKIYISNFNVTEANKLADELIDEFFGGVQLNKKADVKHRFLGAATPKGPVDFIQNLTADIPHRYFIKGRPGSGKSTILKKIAAKAEDLGYDVEIYHCGFDPNSLDMVIMRELGIAIFDSTAPHEHFPDRETDQIIDLYPRLIKEGTDEKYSEELNEIIARYSAKMKEATTHLAKAKELHDKLENIYSSAMNFSVVNDHYERIRKEIIEIEKSM